MDARIAVAGISAAAVALSALTVGLNSQQGSATQGQTTVVCVQKKGGALALPKGNSCKKGWRKTTLGAVGPQGPTGPAGANGQAGPQLSVRDADGTTLGTFNGYQTLGENPTIAVMHDGGLYSYGVNGRLQPSGTAYYLTANCTGKAYAVVAIAAVDELLATVGSAGRTVVRTQNPTPGVARAYRLTSKWNGTMQQYYKVNSTTGNCDPVANLTAAFIEYEQFSAPLDASGPLTVG